METEFFHPPISNDDIILRLAVAAAAGLVLGIDRELRGIAAGIRTHALVAVSAAVIMISSLMLFADVRDMPGVQSPDPLRAIQGIAQAIGFVAAGAIFFARGRVHNLTSAANVWLAASAGIAAGAGQLSLALITIAFGIVIVSVVRVIEVYLPGSDKTSPSEVTDDRPPDTDGKDPPRSGRREPGRTDLGHR